jgi:hypothetical protein
MATGVAGSTFADELNRLANGGTYPVPTSYKSEQGAANAWAQVNFHAGVHVATTIPLTSGVYAAGSTGADGGTGVGATYTANVNGTLSVDGHALSAGEKMLIWKQTDAKVNGIYTVTNAGSGITKWILTRSTTADNGIRASEVSLGDWVGPMIAGSVNIGKYFRMNAAGTGVNGSIVIGTDNITFEEIPAPSLPNGLGIIAALNFKMDPLRPPKQYKMMNAICNELAGTTGLSAVVALRSIDL